VPAPIDVGGVDPCWAHPGSGEIVIGHSPSSRQKKGTNTVLIPAVDRLRKMGHNVRIEMIEKVPHSECVKIKRRLTLFWGQCGMGSYGNSSLEAMQFGIPTMCWISPEAKEWSGGMLDDCPVVSFEPSADGCADAILGLLDMDLERLSRETREWTERTHGLESVGRRYHQIYRSVL